MAFVSRRRARRLFAYLRSERRTLRQGLVALLVSTLAAFVAGIALASITGTLQRIPGLLILIPAAVAMRGTVFGAMAARLGTATHVGVFEVSRRRGGVLYQNLFTAVVQTLAVSLYLAVLVKGAASIFGLPSASFLTLATISVVGGVLSSALLLALTIGLSVISYRRGYDLDTVATPLITAVGDMFSVPLLFAATFLTGRGWSSTVLSVACVATGLAAIVLGVRTDLKGARRVLAESIAVLLLTPILDILAGTVLDRRLDAFVAMPGLLVLIPPLVSQAGALGGILSSRLSSKLQLGLISARRLPEAPALLDASLVFGFAAIVFTAVGGLGFLFSSVAGQAHPGLGTMVTAAFLAGMLVTVVAVVTAYYVAVLATRVGLDPDNHSVPIITSSMDLAGVVSFFLVLAVLGVATNV